MNPEIPHDMSDQIETRITALLLGELSADEAALLKMTLAAQPELQALHDRLKQTIERVGEAVPRNSQQGRLPELRLSEDRRRVLLDRFQSPTRSMEVVRSNVVGSRHPSLPWYLPMALAASLMLALTLSHLEFWTQGALNSKSSADTLVRDRAGGGWLDRLQPGIDTNSTTIPESEALGRRVASASAPQSPGRDEYFRVIARADGTSPQQRTKPEELNLELAAEAKSPVDNPSAQVLSVGETEVRFGAALNLPKDPQLAKIRAKERILAESQSLPILTQQQGVDGRAPAPIKDYSDAQNPLPPGVNRGYASATVEARAGIAIVDGSAAPQMGSSEPPPLPAPEVAGIVSRPGQGGFGEASGPTVRGRSFFEFDKIAVKEPKPALTDASASRLDTATRSTLDRLDTFGTAPTREVLPLSVGSVNGVSTGFGGVAGQFDAAKSTGGDVELRRNGRVTLGKSTAAIGGETAQLVELNSAIQGGASDQQSLSPLPTKPEGMSAGRPAGVVPYYSIKGENQFKGDRKEAAPSGDHPEDLVKNRLDSVALGVVEQRKFSYLAAEGKNAVPPIAAAVTSLAAASADASLGASNDDPRLIRRLPAMTLQPEVVADQNGLSTFSLNVTDVAFKLAAASLEKGVMPEPGSIRSEEFINAFNYRDPEAGPGTPITFNWERAQYPFAHHREMLRFAIRTAAAGREASRPLQLVLLLDNSGSMERADRVAILREALRVLAGQLHAQDRISVVTFARTPRLWVDALAGDQAGTLTERVGSLTPEGGTNLEEALNLAYATAARHYMSDGVNRVVLLTDGAANLGDVAPESLQKKVESWRHRGVALDCFGIGWEGLNDDLLEVLARHGDGRYGFVNTPEEAAGNFANQLAGALHVAAADVKMQVEFNPQRVVLWRQVGYAKHQLTAAQFRDNTVDAAELTAAESGNAVYVVELREGGSGPLATVRARFREPQTGVYRELEWPVPYLGAARSLEQSPSTLRLAAAAAAFSEWLAGSPYAAEVTPDRLLKLLGGVPAALEPDPRPVQLEWMIRQAKTLSGK